MMETSSSVCQTTWILHIAFAFSKSSTDGAYTKLRAFCEITKIIFCKHGKEKQVHLYTTCTVFSPMVMHEGPLYAPLQV